MLMRFLTMGKVLHLSLYGGVLHWEMVLGRVPTSWEVSRMNAKPTAQWRGPPQHQCDSHMAVDTPFPRAHQQGSRQPDSLQVCQHQELYAFSISTNQIAKADIKWF